MKKAVARASGCGKLPRCFYCILLRIAGKKGHIINNVLTSSVRPLQGNLRHDLAIAPSIHQGLGLRFPCNDLTLG